MELQVYHALEDLPPDCVGLFPNTPFDSRWWYDATIAYALPDDAVVCFVTCRQSATSCAVVPLMQRAGVLSSLTTPYSCAYTPVLGADVAALPEMTRHIGRFLRRSPTVRLDAIPSEWPGLAPFIAGLRGARLWVQCFDHFGNWREPVRGRDWVAYLADRPGALRTTLRRKRQRADSLPFKLYSEPVDLAAGVAAFEAVYRASWKQDEPFPQFNSALMQALSAQGMLRLGVLWAGERPAAAQFWCVADGHATVLKLAHDERDKALSPGTVLTAHMLRGLIDDEKVRVLDFGRGDDPYKALWCTERHQRIGLFIMNPARPAGLVAAAKSLLGQGRKYLRARM